jgi:3',5'-cyclic AMP phosphodiesterase CpdA
MSVETAFVLLSDLHFGNNLSESPGIQLLNIPFSYHGTTQKVTDYIVARCRGHYKPCVQRLPRYLKVLLSDLKEDGYQRDKFDLFLLLGDQSTLTHESSYKFLREYLTQDEYETKDADGLERCKGLEIDPGDILAVPGNHDKLLRNSLDLYHDEFTRKAKLLEEVRPQMCSIALRSFADREFVFILLEPSIYCARDLELGSDFRSHLAAGKVSAKLREDVRTKLDILRRYGKLDAQVKLRTNFSDAIKILVVHYAVDGGQFAAGLDEHILPHECEGLGELVEMLKEEYQLSMALHGHLHRPLLYNFKGVQVISATTATRMDKDGKTGFFLVKVLDSGTIRAEHHVWTGVGYTPDPDKNLNRDVGYLRKRAIAA